MSFLTSFFSPPTKPRSKRRRPSLSPAPNAGVETAYTVFLNQKPYKVTARDHPRSTRLTLRWDSGGRVFRLTHPLHTAQSKIQSFLRANHPWMIKVSTLHTEPPTTTSNTIVILGDTCRFVYDPLRSKGIWRVGDVLIVGGEKKDSIPMEWIETFLIEQARHFLTETSHRLAAQLGARIARISIRDGRSRWGSCSSTGTLSYSWRIVLADPKVATYLCAHEVSHLKEMNHSQAFWAYVGHLCPHFKESRRWLKQNGHTLKEKRQYIY